MLVGVAGFEPATPTSRTWCATRLRYTPTEGRYIAVTALASKRSGPVAAPLHGSDMVGLKPAIFGHFRRCHELQLHADRNHSRPARRGL
jgi:hypothetical protein